MERVVTINLNGNPYQLEEPAYDALRTYIARAEAALADNPDKAEIIRDLEQAIADKCGSYLAASKTVISAAEIKRVLDEMGPVEGDKPGDEKADHGAADFGPRPPRRLYRIYDHHAWTGVSAGLAAYAGIDVAWVRTLWILSAIFTGGFTILFYLVLIFAVPVAGTSEELAAAHGAPFNAQEVIDRAKREYGRFAQDSEHAWRRERRAWRRQWRYHSRMWGDAFVPDVAPSGKPVGYVTRMFAGLFAFVFSIITAALLIAFLYALFAVLSTGSVLGWIPPADMPTWMVILVLAIAYGAISAPFRALRRSSYATVAGYPRYAGAADGLITLVLVVVAGWFAYLYWPQAHDFIQSVPDILRGIGASFRDG
jgi:phage shock protein PspC (stress-responsive transcriptional regulator)